MKFQEKTYTPFENSDAELDDKVESTSIPPESSELPQTSSETSLRRIQSKLMALLATKRQYFVIFAFIIANSLYTLTDRKCPYESATACAKDYLLPNAVKWAIQILIVALIFVCIIYIGIQGLISQIFVVLAILNIGYLCFYYHPVMNAHEYGQAFALLLGLILLFFFIVLGVRALIKYSYAKNKRLTVIGVPLLTVLLIIIFYLTRVQGSCDNWTKGLGGEEIINERPTCTIATPPMCAYEITSGWLNFARFKSCSNSKVQESVMNKYYPKAPVIAFPRTEDIPLEERFDLQKAVLERMAPYGSMDEALKSNHEILIDNQDESNPQIKIQIKRNETLVEERSKIPDESLVQNVIVIYIDALSRVNAMRKLPKTMAWFDKYMNQQSEDAEAFQFFKYHVMAPYTLNNLYQAEFGMNPGDVEYNSTNKAKEYVKHFKDNGFITAHASDFCQVTSLDMTPESKIQEVPYDHEGMSFACDPQYHDPESPFSLFQGPYSSVRRCLYSQDVYQHALNYGTQFWNTYKDEKKILYFEFLDAHEGTGEVVQYMDGGLSQFLQELEDSQLLKNTAVLFYSDHGLHMQGLFQILNVTEAFTERSLPAMFTLLPRSVSDHYRTDLKANGQKLVYAHDVFSSLVTLAQGKTSKNLKESLLGPLRADRTCNDIQTQEGSCKCTY